MVVQFFALLVQLVLVSHVSRRLSAIPEDLDAYRKGSSLLSQSRTPSLLEVHKLVYFMQEADKPSCGLKSGEVSCLRTLSTGGRHVMKRLPAYLVVGGLLILTNSSCTESRIQTKEESSIEQQGQQETENPAEIVGKDGAPMDLVPAGSFLMGSPEGVGRDDEHPEHEVWLDDYYIDRYEVTVELFAKCVQAGVCSEEHIRTVDDDPACNYGDANRVNHPMNCVDWFGMKTYCEWAGKRLPTEAEWERAARGTDGRMYPWGNEEATCEHAVMDEDKTQDCEGATELPYTEPGGTKIMGVGPYGSHNLGGNVGEWCLDIYDETFYTRSPNKNPVNTDEGRFRATRGGDCRYTSKNVTTYRTKVPPNGQSFTLGGRCAVRER